MIQKRRRIGQILKEMVLVTETQINQALVEQRLNPTKKIGEILIERKIITPIQVAQAIMHQWKERISAYEDHSVVIQSIKSLLGKSENIFDLQKALVGIMDELENLREDLEALYQVSLAIAKDKGRKTNH